LDQKHISSKNSLNDFQALGEASSIFFGTPHFENIFFFMRFICRGKISGGLRDPGHAEYPQLDQDQGKPFLNTSSSLQNFLTTFITTFLFILLRIFTVWL
jgi:hypothetical protein